MRNPLTKRIPREIKDDLGKYIALFLFLILSIGFISGFLVAGDSMKSAFDNSFEKYNVEDGHFCLAAEIDDKTKENVESLVRYLIKYKIEDGQLSSADITLREIEVIIKAFLDVLQGAYHQRIQYPKVGENKKLVEDEDFKHE